MAEGYSVGPICFGNRQVFVDVLIAKHPGILPRSKGSFSCAFQEKPVASMRSTSCVNFEHKGRKSVSEIRNVKCIYTPIFQANSPETFSLDLERWFAVLHSKKNLWVYRVLRDTLARCNSPAISKNFCPLILDNRNCPNLLLLLIRQRYELRNSFCCAGDL